MKTNSSLPNSQLQQPLLTNNQSHTEEKDYLNALPANFITIIATFLANTKDVIALSILCKSIRSNFTISPLSRIKSIVQKKLAEPTEPSSSKYKIIIFAKNEEETTIIKKINTDFANLYNKGKRIKNCNKVLSLICVFIYLTSSVSFISGMVCPVLIGNSTNPIKNETYTDSENSTDNDIICIWLLMYGMLSGIVTIFIILDVMCVTPIIRACCPSLQSCCTHLDPEYNLLTTQAQDLLATINQAEAMQFFKTIEKNDDNDEDNDSKQQDIVLTIN